MGIASWFTKDTRRSQHEALESVVGPTASVTGHLRSDGGVRIDGIFEGVIEVAGNVVIGEGARVVADITARNVTVGGAVKGNIDATGRLEILSRGQVFGDIMVAQVMIDEGGIFQGNSRMRGIEQRALQPPAEKVSERNIEVVGSAQAETAGVAIEPETGEATTVEGSSRPLPDSSADDLLDLAEGIEPIIPDVVIEEVPQEEPTPPRRRSGRPARRR